MHPVSNNRNCEVSDLQKLLRGFQDSFLPLSGITSSQKEAYHDLPSNLFSFYT
jgi:hypothetical protein